MEINLRGLSSLESNLKKEDSKKLTQNGDKSYTSTGNDLVDLMFMAEYFTNNLNEVNIGSSDKEKLFSLYMRDPVDGKGYRDLGRELMKQAGNNPKEIVTVGRFDDLWNNPTQQNLEHLLVEVAKGNELAKKWMPRLQSKDKEVAKKIAQAIGLSEKKYRKFIKTDSTVEYKLSYAEQNNGSHLEELFNDKQVVHPLVDEIKFSEVPSLAMTKYIKAFSTRDDLKGRFGEYIEEVKDGKTKINTKTANVRDAQKLATSNVSVASDVVAKEIVKQETDGLALNAIVVLDTSGSMNWGYGAMGIPYDNAMAVAHAVATNSTYEKNKVISFSSNPRLMEIKGSTLNEQYKSMHTGDVSNTDLGKVFEILKGLKKFPEYVVVLSDMEFDQGSSTSMNEWKQLLKDNGARTKLIWWNFNQQNRTSPEYNPDGSIFMSGYDVRSLMQLPGVIDTDEFIDNILKEYSKKLIKKIK